MSRRNGNGAVCASNPTAAATSHTTTTVCWLAARLHVCSVASIPHVDTRRAIVVGTDISNAAALPVNPVFPECARAPAPARLVALVNDVVGRALADRLVRQPERAF